MNIRYKLTFLEKCHRLVCLIYITVDMFFQRGEYNTFANLHSGIVTMSAHTEPNFFGWHRVYLSLYGSFFVRNLQCNLETAP